MGTQKIILAFAALVVVGGGAWYVSQNQNANVSSTDETVDRSEDRAAEPIEENENDFFSGNGTFDDLFTRGESFKCTFTTEDENGTMEGVAYVDGKNERYSTGGTMIVDGTEQTFGAITTTDMVYWWGDTPEGKQGMKMPAPEEGDFEVDESVRDLSYSEGQTTISKDQEVSYECEKWRVDESQFVPPADVVFTDMAEMFESMMQGMPEGFEMPEGFPAGQ